MKVTGTISVVVPEPVKKEKKFGIKDFVIYFLIFSLAGTSGFFIGKGKKETIEIDKTVYVKGDTVTVMRDSIVPVNVYVMPDTFDIISDCVKKGIYAELFPEKVRDSIVYLTKSDTSEIVKDWASIREYEEELFNIDTVGVAKIYATTQYNRITYLNSTFIPYEKETFVERKKTAYFVGAGLTTDLSASAEIGALFKNNFGASVEVGRDFSKNKNFVGANFLYRLK